MGRRQSSMSTKPADIPFQVSCIACTSDGLEESRLCNSTSLSIAKSKVDLAIPPAASKEAATCHAPFMLTAPGVSFKAYRAALLAGVVREPEVSVPRENGLKPAATPTADPVDDPPGAYTLLAMLEYDAASQVPCRPCASRRVESHLGCTATGTCLLPLTIRRCL
jgi:hypothetical protein